MALIPWCSGCGYLHTSARCPWTSTHPLLSNTLSGQQLLLVSFMRLVWIRIAPGPLAYCICHPGHGSPSCNACHCEDNCLRTQVQPVKERARKNSAGTLGHLHTIQKIPGPPHGTNATNRVPIEDAESTCCKYAAERCRPLCIGVNIIAHCNSNTGADAVV